MSVYLEFQYLYTTFHLMYVPPVRAPNLKQHATMFRYNGVLYNPTVSQPIAEGTTLDHEVTAECLRMLTAVK